MFGGIGRAGTFNDTWAYDPGVNTWTDLTSSGTQPAARWNHAMAYDQAVDRVIMFGGYSGPTDNTGEFHDDTWAYDAKANAWAKLEPSGAVPPARAAHMMAYDPVARLMIVFGGWRTAARGHTIPLPTPGSTSPHPGARPGRAGLLR